MWHHRVKRSVGMGVRPKVHFERGPSGGSTEVVLVV